MPKSNTLGSSLHNTATTSGFREILDNVEIMNVIFQRILMTGCKDMDKKNQNTPKIVFSQFVTPRLTSCKN